MATDHPTARDFDQRYVAALAAELRHALEGAVARGELSGDLDVVAWSQKLSTTLIEMMVLLRSRVDPTLAPGAAQMAIDELRTQACAALPCD